MSNLPPGISDSDISGNTRSDEAVDAVCNKCEYSDICTAVELTCGSVHDALVGIGMCTYGDFK